LITFGVIIELKFIVTPYWAEIAATRQTMARFVVPFVLLQTTAVRIVIKNNGCDPINPVVNMPISIPGLTLPRETIPDGGAGVATLPPLNIEVDGTSENTISLKVLGYSMTFELQNKGIDVVFDDTSLLGRKTSINLGEKKEHELIARCL